MTKKMKQNANIESDEEKEMNFDEAILVIKNAKDKVRKMMIRDSKDIGHYSKMAKDALERKNEDLARMYLKIKKLKESSQSTYMNQLMEYESQLNAIHVQESQYKLVSVTKNVANCLTEAQKAMGSIEEIEKMMNDTESLITHAQEVDDLLNARLGTVAEDASMDEEFELFMSNALEQKSDQAAAAADVSTVDDTSVCSSECASEAQQATAGSKDVPMADDNDGYSENMKDSESSVDLLPSVPVETEIPDKSVSSVECMNDQEERVAELEISA